MGFMAKLQRFMYGRNGMDSFSFFLVIFALVVDFLASDESVLSLSVQPATESIIAVARESETSFLNETNIFP